MTRFAYLFAGGAAFYPTLFVILVALIAIRFTRNRTAIRVERVVLVIAAVIVVLSAVPIAIWLYLVWALAIVFAVLILGRNDPSGKSIKNVALAAGLVTTIALMSAEAPYRIAPDIPYKSGGVLYTLGDSLSMGADTMDGNWPALLAGRARMEVRAFAFGGARVSSALSNVNRVEPDASLIIVELGGNDIFYDTTPTDFAEDLDRMLDGLSRPGAPVVLLELPLPPFYNRFGSAQRRLAAKHGAMLVPRSVFARVLATPGATIDGLHLSNSGHEHLANALWELRAGDS
jgi:acyl-CoA thioesterase-1